MISIAATKTSMVPPEWRHSAELNAAYFRDGQR
jgi:hypothetical protein